MILNRKVTITNPLDVGNAIRSAEINRYDLKEPILQSNLISESDFSGRLTILEPDEEIKKYRLELRNHNLRERYLLAYDESIQKYVTLQGLLIFTAHSLVGIDNDDYDYSCNVTAYFVTRAKRYEKVPLVIVADDLETALKKRYLEDRAEFMITNVPSGSILFIDGPLIGAQSSSENVKLVRSLMKRNVIPIFYVKNSSSNIVVENLGGSFKELYNNDLDFVNKFLDIGQRTSFFVYSDDYNKDFQKVFSYLKCYDKVPQRFEVHFETFSTYKELMHSLTELTYYLSVLHGDYSNPQLRTVAIAERFARDSLEFFSPSQLVEASGLDETMNSIRGFE